MLRRRFRTLVAAALGLGLVGIPAALGIYWRVEVEPEIEQALAARLGRRVVVGSARPRIGGVRLSDVVIFGAPPFEKVPLLQAGALDVDVGFGSRALGGLSLHHARLAVVKDGERGGDNIGDLSERLFRHSGSGSGGAPMPVVLDDGSLEIAYRDSGGARWVVRADGVDARVVGGSGTVHAGRLRIEIGKAAAEFNAARFEVEGGHVTRAGSAAGRLALAGAEDLIGGARLDAHRDAGVWRLRAQAAHVKVSGEVDGEGARVTVDADRLPLAPLRPLGDAQGFGTAGATLDGHVALRFLPRRDALGLEGRAEVAGVTITNPRVTSGAISHAGVRVAGSLVASPRKGRVAVDQAVVRLGDLAFWLHGAVEDVREGGRGDLELRVDETPCQAALESLPPGLAPALEGASLGGELSARGKLRYDIAHLDDLLLDIDIRDRCVVLRDPPRADVTRLRRAVVPYRIEDESGQTRDFPLGPGNPDWRPLSAISPHLVGAFLTAEDAGFYHHHGFEPEYIRRALIENLRKGRVVRGASTISQQLVKNLYLDKSRTFARKLQEAALTWRMEQAVPKWRILELYLNMIELGPGIYGVRQASRRYFGKEPSQLSPLEAAHLASVAPNPKGYWTRFHRGPVGDEWTEKLYDLLGMMHRSHRLSDQDFAAAMSSRLHFED